MCRKGTVIDYLEDMQKDVYSKYKMVVAQGVSTEKEAFELTQKMPSRRFWVSSNQAYKICMAIHRGDLSVFDHMPQYRVDMFQEIYRRFIQQRNKLLFRGKKPYFIIPFIIAQEAPRFYISVDTIRKIVYKQRKYHQAQWKKLAKRPS